MKIKEQLKELRASTEKARVQVAEAGREQYRITQPLFKRVERYFIATKFEDFNPPHTEIRAIGLYTDEEAYISIYDNYYGAYPDDDPLIPWNILDMSDKEFNQWEEDQTKEEREAQLKQKLIDEEESRERRRKQWEELNKEFGA